MSRPIGGVNGIMEMIAALKDAGHDARPLYSSHDGVYEHARVPPAEGLYDPLLADVFAEQGRRARLGRRAARLRLAFSPATLSTRNERLPVADGDVASLVRAARAAASEYDSDRSRLDDLRRAASDFVATTYSDEVFRRDVCAAFEESAARIS
ncbi:hypothetical protein [Rhodovulum sp. 12E13]|uniref:hypothetical protein n=1 Tax=Rhodovulum sp. 12E13 TaxID=2203891 RepID=UPI0011C07B15|nr:hypothetical protein [Rhodovulum sp. 12E13]